MSVALCVHSYSTEALGLLINPVDSSPPLKTRATTIKSNSVTMQTQNISQQFGAAPPSPTHTASPPSATSGFLPAQNPPTSQGSGFLRPQQRVPAPMIPPTTASRLTDSWGPEEELLGDTSLRDDRIVDQRPRPGSGPLADLSRTSPISVNSQQSARSVDARNRNARPRPTHTTSSPPLIRSQQMPSPTQQIPLGTNIPPSLAGFIPPAPPGPTIPLLNRSMTDATITSARPLLTPPSSDHMGRRDSPHRNQSPPYRAPPEVLGPKPAPKDYSQHFQYDNDDQQSQYDESQGEITDREPSPSVAVQPLAQAIPTRMPERRFPFQEEVELDDDVTPSGLLHHQQQPPRWPNVNPQQPQQPPVKQQDLRGPSPPPASPSPQPPIPIIAPQSYPAAPPPILDHDHRDESPPRAPSAGQINAQRYPSQNFEQDEPAEASSDHHTPKSPTGPLPADYHSFAQYNNPRFRRGQIQDQLAYQHALFAYQMSGMPAPRGPTHIPRNDQNYASLGGVAAAITGDTSNNGYGGNNMYDHWDGLDFNEAQSPATTQRGFGTYSNNRPDAPIPPTPHSITNVASPPTYPRPSYGMMDPPAHMIPERYIPSALSSYLSSPIMHNPFLPRFPPPQSLVSSPSHIPLELTPAPLKKLGRKKSKKQLRQSKLSKQSTTTKVPPVPNRQTSSQTATNALEPPRIGAESTVPKESSSEESDTDDTKKLSTSQRKVVSDEEEEEEDVWVDESSEDELDTEYHSRYILNPSKRKRKWEQKWDAMVRLFQEIDRTTDSPMLLLAAPSTSNSPKTHIVVSRAIQRDPGKYMPHAQTARVAFSQISKSRRQEKAEQAAAEKARRAASFEQQLVQAATIGDSLGGSAGTGSPGSGGFSKILGGLNELQNLPQLASSGEEGMQQALQVALESLKQMHMCVS
ncbi:hypothetical protein FRC03_002998 [Tulasnella sp. 419]|nr:hypothetical protein FRC03_002998 [Tulasnella sp. 419]